jgi:hypothetical protein
MSSSTTSSSAHGYLSISSWLHLVDITRFRTNQDQGHEALLAYTNTNVTGLFNIDIPQDFKDFTELLQEPKDDDLPITMTTFLTRLDLNDWSDKVVDVSGYFWPNARKFVTTTDGTAREDLHIIIRLDDYRLCW